MPKKFTTNLPATSLTKPNALNDLFKNRAFSELKKAGTSFENGPIKFDLGNIEELTNSPINIVGPFSITKGKNGPVVVCENMAQYGLTQAKVNQLFSIAKEGDKFYLTPNAEKLSGVFVECAKKNSPASPELKSIFKNTEMSKFLMATLSAKGMATPNLKKAVIAVYKEAVIQTKKDKTITRKERADLLWNMKLDLLDSETIIKSGVLTARIENMYGNNKTA